MGQSTDELRREIEQTREDLGETFDTIGDRVSPRRMVERRKNRVRDGMRRASERVMGTASDTGHAIGDTRSSIGSAAGGAVDTLREAPAVVQHQTKGNPLTAGAIAFGVGVLAASIFKPSELERQAADQLKDKAQPLKDELMHSGEEMAEHMKEPARSAMEQVKEAATEGAQTVAGTAKDAASTSKDTARDAVDSVRSTATADQSDPPT